MTKAENRFIQHQVHGSLTSEIHMFVKLCNLFHEKLKTRNRRLSTEMQQKIFRGEKMI